YESTQLALSYYPFLSFFFSLDPSTAPIYTLSLHDALPICSPPPRPRLWAPSRRATPAASQPSQPSTAATPRAAITKIGCAARWRDRKSTRLNSSHVKISYAVFCLKKKKRYM